MKVTAYVDVLSHWCLAAWPAIEALHATLADDVELQIVIAPAFDGAPTGFTNAQESWYYRRGTLAYGTSLRADWVESDETTTWHANVAVAAAVAMGADAVDIGVRTSRAALVEGKLLGREAEAARTVAQLAGLNEAALLEKMRSDELQRAVHGGNVSLAALGCGERPSWELRNDNGDHAVLQGVWQAEAILPLARALLEDERAYRRAGTPPSWS